LAKKKANSKSAKTVPFEQSLEQLREVVGQLETGNLTLSESLEKYEQGVASLKSCYEALNQAQRKIELLVDLDEEGNLVTRPFDDTASDQMTQGTRRSPQGRPADDITVEDEEEEDEEYEEDDDLEDMDDPGSLF
jgi:exodeoxyribonuclease VII small subunit